MLDNLQTFIDVASTGTFSGVAKARNTAVSSIARQVDALEASLGYGCYTAVRAACF